MQKLLFAGLILVIGVLIFFANKKDDTKEIHALQLKGCNFLTPNDYLSFAGLLNKDLHGLTPGQIRDRIKKHPYIKDVAVTFTAPELLEVQIQEKVFKARLLAANQDFFITSELEMIKHLAKTRTTDLPLLTGIQCKESDTLSVQETQKMKDAVALINASEMDTTVYGKNLSEISFLDSGSMSITLANLRPSLIFATKNIEKQVQYVLALLKNKETYTQLLTDALYLDVRFQKKIFIGYALQSGT